MVVRKPNSGGPMLSVSRAVFPASAPRNFRLTSHGDQPDADSVFIGLEWAIRMDHLPQQCETPSRGGLSRNSQPCRRRAPLHPLGERGPIPAE